MIGSLPISLTVGALQVATALCILAKQVILGPAVRNYPNGTRRLRLTLFALGAVLLYFGLETIELAWHGQRFSRPSALILSAVWMGAAEAELEKVLRQWLPERLQRRVQRLWEFASCANAQTLRRRRELDAQAVQRGVRVKMAPPKVVGAALAELKLEGWAVVGPEEPKEALND